MLSCAAHPDADKFIISGTYRSCSPRYGLSFSLSCVPVKVNLHIFVIGGKCTPKAHSTTLGVLDPVFK